MSWFEDKVTDPISDATEDLIGEGAYDVLADTLTYAAQGSAALALAGTAVVAAPVAVPAYQAYLAHEAGGDAKDQANAAAIMEKRHTEEQVRILKEENKRRESTARARASASGVSGASSELYMESLEEAGRADIAWLEEVGASRFDARIAEGESAYQSAQMQMWGYIGSSVSGLAQPLNILSALAL